VAAEPADRAETAGRPSLEPLTEVAGTMEAAPVDAPQAPEGLLPTLLAPHNLLVLSFMAVYGLISNFYIVSQTNEFTERYGHEDGLFLSSTFDIAFPVGGFCTAFPATLFMRRFGEKEHIYWSVLLGLTLLFTFLYSVPTYTTQMLAALIFGPIRCLQWACYFQYLACERRYAPSLVGRALGYNNVAFGFVADALPSLLTSLVEADGWGGDAKGRYSAIKSVLLVLLTCTSAFQVLLWRQWRARGEPSTHPTGMGLLAVEEETPADARSDSSEDAFEAGSTVSL